ncbi:aminoacyl-histidine dipeptidase [Candidatus Methanocrinis natronophilus]|uniref:Aminoacyl-histidine dipeptidase n=1 Tax=Candidatus Methanocrinis natronophilus TaxID=3033396 RepID=A0ABT5XB51_9EURY|nr:aminoacyl-histidine dipeptidase [Candidatus Methanocrinis natronophilus]MDF0591922.1 aminoacyl-histidine dipeptidase [Candidatus Methanocrinis natronophilus]
MVDDLSGIEPRILWGHFNELRKIPRCSKDEGKAAEYVLSFGRRLRFDSEMDSAGNVVIRKAATPGREASPGVLLQAHLDMVCEKNRDTDHDFLTDPIDVIVEGGFVSAVGTTLGADNGIGVAAALAVLEDSEAVHGPLELLFTVDEEDGMSGAKGLEVGQISAKMMINLDTDDPHAVYVGCAGGETSNLRLPAGWVRPDQAGSVAFEVSFRGLAGGHSGVDIHLERGNAIKLLGHLLWVAGERTPLGLSSLRGGEKHNAIPREAEAVVVVPGDAAEAFRSLVEEMGRALSDEYRRTDPGLSVAITPGEMPAKVATPEGSRRAIGLVVALPSGILRWSPEIPDLVETSTNLSVASAGEEEIFLQAASRSSSKVGLEATTATIRAAAALAGARVERGDRYPGRLPDLDSALLSACNAAHRDLFGREPEVKSIHAGLEMGILGEKFPEMDMVSLGTTIEHPHSPAERVKISAVAEFYRFLLAALEKVSEMEGTD